ncbi:MAG: peptide ABC transporter substrate-binding protein [Chloroflexi bacterium]|nr:peptide ABC transporter substrate-binding protein [Chloroflexota bacterium]
MRSIQAVTQTVWLALFAALLAVATACGAEPGGGSDTGSIDRTSGTPPSSPQGELRVNLSGEPPTLDPNRASFAASVTVLQQLFDGLLTFQPDMTLAPAVAKEIPSLQNGGISKDLLTYTFKLRTDVKWSDGKPVTARDFEYSIKRMLDPKLAADYASTYYDIKGAQAYNTALGTEAAPKQGDDATLARLRDAIAVKATDDHTLVIELAQPRPTFLQLMALWPVYPLRKDVIEAKGDEKWTEAGNLIGNGPFQLSEWVHQDHITLVPNPQYYGEQPKLAKITLFMVTDANADYAAYRNDERDMTEVPLPVVKQVLANPEQRKELIRFSELVTFAYLFNTKRAPFDNPKVRLAFSKAINREAFVDKVSSGVGKPAYSWVPPGMPGYDEKLGKDLHAFDPAKAKQLLAEAGFADVSKLPPVAFQYANAGANPIRAEFFQSQIKENLGIEVKLEPMEPASFSKAVNAKQFQIAFYGWGADYPDPDNWLPDIFGTEGSQNAGQYSNPRFDAAVKQAMAEPDNAKRLQLWGEAQKIMIEDAPIIPLIYRERFWLAKPSVKGLVTTPKDARIPGDKFLKKVWLDKR